jgi:hypothetical protein
MSDFAVGNFDDDPRADIFYADGKAWYMSSGGVGAFKPLDVSSFRVNDLRFGDFNNGGKTDIFGITSGTWQVEYGGATTWQPLPVTLTKSVAGLMVVDISMATGADAGWLSAQRLSMASSRQGGRTPGNATTPAHRGPLRRWGQQGTRRANVPASGTG